MQKFSYHSHTNGIYDGCNTIEEMITQAENLGWESYGISNHLVCHPKSPSYQKMFFQDFEKVFEQSQRTIDEIRTCALKHKIPVYVGFEVDFFMSSEWRKEFEKILPKLEVDYLIGAVHTLQSDDGNDACWLYDRDRTQAQTQAYLSNYWKTVKEAIQSGYFNWMAHLDLLKYFQLSQPSDWENEIEVSELLAKHQMATELNTSAMRRGLKEFYPGEPFLKELNRQTVALLISDDAHSVNDLGSYFNEAEELLNQLNWKNHIQENAFFE